MRGYLTRSFHYTVASIGYYDMSKNEMVEVDTITGQWKTNDQIIRHVKKNREQWKIPKDKQITVLGVVRKTELRRMTYDDFYAHSEVVPEKQKETKQETKKQNKKRRK